MPDTPLLLPRPRTMRWNGERVSDRPASVEIDHRAGLPSQGYRLTVSAAGVRLVAADEAGAFYGRQTLRQVRSQSDDGHLPACEIEDWPSLPVRGVMLDVSRDKVPTMDTLEALIDRLASWKINHVQLYMEHTFAYPGHDEVWQHADPFTADDIDRLDAFCRARQVELAANQNTLGHMERWLRHPRYLPLAVDQSGFKLGGRHYPAMTMDPSHPGALALAREMLGALVPHFASARVHVGLDEPWELPDERFDDYLDYVRNLRSCPELDGREMLIWGDIVAKHPESVADLPDGVTICDWGYEGPHPTVERGESLAASGHPFWVCPGTSSWNSILGRASIARTNISTAATAGVDHGAEALLVTDWGDNGHLQYLPVSEPWLAYAGAVAWCPDANVDIDLAAGVDAHVMLDRAGRLGGALFDLADLHRRVPQGWFNGSVITANLYSPRLRMGEGRTEQVTDESLQDVLHGLAAAEAAVGSATPRRSDAEVIVAELSNAIALVTLLVDDARHRLAVGGRLDGVDATVRRQLAARLDDIATEHRRLWVVRNRPGGLDDSVSRLDKLRDAYLS